MGRKVFIDDGAMDAGTRCDGGKIHVLGCNCELTVSFGSRNGFYDVQEGGYKISGFWGI